MLNDKAILIIEDNIFLAMDLSYIVEEMDGRVAGPVRTAAEALALLQREEIVGAVIDCDLVDADLPLIVMQLAEREIPVVIHTVAQAPPEIARIIPEAPVLRIPVQPKAVMAVLAKYIHKPIG